MGNNLGLDLKGGATLGAAPFTVFKKDGDR
jgi:hypothetical protein